MAALGAHGFPVPRAVEHNRHAVLMSLVDATLLVQARMWPLCKGLGGLLLSWLRWARMRSVCKGLGGFLLSWLRSARTALQFCAP